MNVTVLPPGYAHGYSPEGEIEDFIRDVAPVAQPQEVMSAMRRNTSWAWHIEKRLGWKHGPHT